MKFVFVFFFWRGACPTIYLKVKYNPPDQLNSLVHVCTYIHASNMLTLVTLIFVMMRIGGKKEEEERKKDRSRIQSLCPPPGIVSIYIKLRYKPPQVHPEQPSPCVCSSS